MGRAFLMWWRALVCIGLLSGSVWLQAEVLVIANTALPVDTLTKRQVIDLFMGRTRNVGINQPVEALDYPAGTPVRSDFYNVLTGKSEAQIDAYWATLVFGGRVPPLKKVASEASAVRTVSKSAAAIAYVSDQVSLPSSVKVVAQFRTDP